MKKKSLKSPCFNCAKLEKSKYDCASECEDLKGYQRSFRLSNFENLKGSAFEADTANRGIRRGKPPAGLN